jgi:DNA-binding XRE family transcriptional regulator
MNIQNIKNMSSIGIQWLFKQAAPNRWNLNHSDLANLLGVSEESILKFEHELKIKIPIDLTEDSRNRLSKLLTIHKSIYELSPQGQEVKFFISSNCGNFLNGKSIKDFLIDEATLEAMDKVIIWLKSTSSSL